MKKIKITILLDVKNNWIQPFILNSILMKNCDKYEFRISLNHLDIKNQDIVFILGYTKILNAEFLGANKLNVVVHESDLPKGKGFAPVQWQILGGAKFIPICLIEATAEVDSGNILFKKKFELLGYELYDEIREKQAAATIQIISEFLEVFPNHNGVKQFGLETFYRKRTINDSELDIDKSIREQFNHLRVSNNTEWPAFFYYEGRKYFLKIFSDERKND